MLFFSLILLPLNKDPFITPASIYAVLFLFIQLLGVCIQHSFHHSGFYLYSIPFVTPASL